MNYIYDLVLNFREEYLDFYEWEREDSILFINKIPIIRVNNIQYDEIIKNRIKFSKELLFLLKNKTSTDKGLIKYSLLITDGDSVIGLKLNDEGIVEMISKLLYDEELAVIEEIIDMPIDTINYEIIQEYSKELLLTRKERRIKNILLKEIKSLYDKNEYEEIDYLYKEIFNDSKNYLEEYDILMDEINNNFNDKYICLYEIVKLTQ